MADRPKATLDDLHGGALVADPPARALYEVRDRRTHREKPDAEPVEQVQIIDLADSVEDELDGKAPPKWIPASKLVGMELVKAPQGAGTPRRTVAKLA